MIATTAAKIGRSMKKRENMAASSRLLADRDFDAPGVAVAAGAGHVLRRLEADAVGGNPLGDQRVAHGHRAPLGEFDVGARGCRCGRRSR